MINHPAFKLVSIIVIAGLVLVGFVATRRLLSTKKAIDHQVDYQIPTTSPTDITPSPAFSELTARDAATNQNTACSSIGTIGATEVYNPNSQTWWFTLTPFQAKAGCKPACVVSAEQKIDVNWRCTGLQPAQ